MAPGDLISLCPPLINAGGGDLPAFRSVIDASFRDLPSIPRPPYDLPMASGKLASFERVGGSDAAGSVRLARDKRDAVARPLARVAHPNGPFAPASHRLNSRPRGSRVAPCRSGCLLGSSTARRLSRARLIAGAAQVGAPPSQSRGRLSRVRRLIAERHKRETIQGRLSVSWVKRE